MKFDQSDYVIAPERLISELVERMDQLWMDKPKAGNKEWTREVKKFLAQIAASLFEGDADERVEAIYTGIEPDVSEFLFDVIWWYRRGKPATREYLALAAEIEWASFWWGAPGETFSDHVRDRVCEDFSKLTVAKCPLKLMVFCTDKSGSERSHAPMQKVVLDAIEHYLNPYAHMVPGETYIFIDVASQGNRSAWIREVDAYGHLAPLRPVVLEG